MIYLYIPFGILFMLAFWAVQVPFILLGFFLVPVAIAFRESRISPYTGKEILNAPKWLWPWGNDEDGYAPIWYTVVRPTWSWQRRMWVWAAWRNSLNNIRFWKILGPPPVVGKVKYIKHGPWYFIWQGPYCRIVYAGPKGWLAAGWKYWIDDATKPCTDIRRFGVGFGAK